VRLSASATDAQRHAIASAHKATLTAVSATTLALTFASGTLQSNATPQAPNNLETLQFKRENSHGAAQHLGLLESTPVLLFVETSRSSLLQDACTFLSTHWKRIFQIASLKEHAA
jgi:hypothetical protein